MESADYYNDMMMIKWECGSGTHLIALRINLKTFEYICHSDTLISGNTFINIVILFHPYFPTLVYYALISE